MHESILILTFTTVILLFAKALSKLINWSLTVMAMVAAGVLGGATTIDIPITDSTHVNPFEALVAVLTGSESMVPLPDPELYTPVEEQTLVEILADPIAGQTFALHLLAAVLVMLIVYGLLETSWVLAFLGGVFTTGFIVWLDYLWLAYEHPILTEHEFIGWTLVAGLGAGLGFVVTVLVVELVFDQERDRAETEREMDAVFDDLNL